VLRALPGRSNRGAVRLCDTSPSTLYSLALAVNCSLLVLFGAMLFTENVWRAGVAPLGGGQLLSRPVLSVLAVATSISSCS
jgi:hypothetical protein